MFLFLCLVWCAKVSRTVGDVMIFQSLSGFVSTGIPFDCIVWCTDSWYSLYLQWLLLENVSCCSETWDTMVLVTWKRSLVCLMVRSTSYHFTNGFRSSVPWNRVSEYSRKDLQVLHAALDGFDCSVTDRIGLHREDTSRYCRRIDLPS